MKHQVFHAEVDAFGEFKHLSGDHHFMGMGESEPFLGQFLNLFFGHFGFSQNRAHTDIGINAVHGRVSVVSQHFIIIEAIITHAGHSHVVVLHGSNADFFGELFEVFLFQVGFFAQVIRLHSGFQIFERSVLGLIQKIHELHIFAASGLELLSVGAQDQAKGHMVHTHRFGRVPAHFAGSSKDFLEMLALTGVSDIDAPISS